MWWLAPRRPIAGPIVPALPLVLKHAGNDTGGVGVASSSCALAPGSQVPNTLPRVSILSNVTMHHRPHRPDSEGAVSRQDPPTPGPAFQARSQKRPTLDKVVLAPGLRVVMPNEASPDSRPSRQEQSRVLLVPQPQADAPGGPVPLQSGTSWRRCRKISPDAVFPTTRPGKDWEPGNFRRCGK